MTPKTMRKPDRKGGCLQWLTVLKLIIHSGETFILDKAGINHQLP